MQHSSESTHFLAGTTISYTVITTTTTAKVLNKKQYFVQDGLRGGGTDEPACRPNSLIRYLTIEYMSPLLSHCKNAKKNLKY